MNILVINNIPLTLGYEWYDDVMILQSRHVMSAQFQLLN